MFRWGIIGPGNIAKDFIKDLEYVSDQPQQVVAVLSHQQQGAKEFAEQHNVSQYFDDINKFIKETKLNAVYIATPHTLHYE